MKVLVFDLFGDFAHFRKYYTTTSPLTFSFPPPPTIAGILGAIYGASKEEYLEVFSYEKCKIALRILEPIKKVRLGLNLINTKENRYLRLFKAKHHEPRIQVRTEFVKGPRYRIYVHHTVSEVFQKLTTLIEKHSCFYTVSLGLSELLADFKYVGVFQGQEVEAYETCVNTVIPLEKVKPRGIIIEPNKKYFKEKIPVIMRPDRVVEKYCDVIYEPGGLPIKVLAESAYKLDNGETIIFF